MRKFGKESTAPEKGESRGNDGGWLRSHWCLLSLAVIVVVAFLIRTVFAYGTSADGDFALSGGSAAEYHLHMIENILSGSFSLSDSAVNYPYGGSNAYPPLLDFLGAIPAFIFSATGMSTASAASAGLAVITPIIGALTCIPVYLVGKELYDRRIGVVAALIFAFLALPVSTSVFSNGTEYSLAAFLVAFMSLFMIKTAKALDDSESGKAFLKPAIVSGVLFGLAALSWNGFGILLYIPIIVMFIQMFVCRFNGKGFTDVLIAYSVIMLVGTIIAAIYYVPAGLFEQYASSPLFIAIISIVFAAVFKALASKPWVVVVPALVIAAIAIFVVLAVALPDIYGIVVGGASIYANETIGGLINTRVSMSNVASYYGWLTMWLPLCLAFYETYVLLKKERSSLQLFKTLWLYIMFFIVWTTVPNAAAVAVVFGVASGAALVKLIEAANLREWYSGMKAAGFPGMFKKMIKPLPFASVLIVAILVIVPNVTYGVDAGMPNNNDPIFGDSGNTQFVIKTGDEYPAGMVWDYYDGTDKDGALVNWINSGYDAVTLGGFQTVTDPVGGGAIAASSVYLSEGSAGAISSMTMRLAMSDKNATSLLPSEVQKYVEDPATAREAINASPSVYGYVDADMEDESAVYLASVRYLIDNYSTHGIMELYRNVCNATGEKISYIYMDASMLPLQVNDGTSFPTMALVGGYAIDSNGAARQFFTYNQFYGTTTYTSAMYDTFLWKAMVGKSASEAGISDSYQYLTELVLNKGDLKVTPGLVEGFDIGCWFVRYNPDDRATVTSEGWEYMDINDARTKQKADGGLINYLSSIMVLEYRGAVSSSYANINITDEATGDPVNGASVKVYAYNVEYDEEVLFSEGKSINGKCEVSLPAGKYTAVVSIGDVVIDSSDDISTLSAVSVKNAELNGQVYIGDSVFDADEGYAFIEFTGAATGKVYSDSTVGYSIITSGGKVRVNSMLPDVYSYTIANASGTSIGSGTVSVTADATNGVAFVLKSYKITATVTGQDNLPVSGATVVATDYANKFDATAVTDSEGKAVLDALPGTYAMTLTNNYAVSTSRSVTISSSDRTTDLTAFDARTVTVNGSDGHDLSVFAGEYTASTTSNGTKVDLPRSIATDLQKYSFYGVFGDRVYTGVYESGSTVSVTSSAAVTVSGTLKNNGSSTSGVVRFIADNGFYVPVATDSDGAFKVRLPAGNYTIYADNNSSNVYIGKRTVSGDIGDIELVDGRKITLTLRYDARLSSGTNKYLPFVMSSIDYAYEGTNYTLYGMSNTSGASAFFIPDNITAKIQYNNGALNNAAFACTELFVDIESGTSNTTKYVDIKAQNKEGDVKNVMKKVSVTADYPMTMEYYSSSASDVPEEDLKYTFSAGQTLQVVPGQYDVVIDGSTGAYYKGTGNVFAGTNGLKNADIVQVLQVNMTKGTSDAVVVSPVELDGKTGKYFIDGSTYYFEKGFEYYITSTNGQGDDQKINYGYLEATGSTPVTMDVTATAGKMTIRGYVGGAFDGDLIVTYGATGTKAKFAITAGAYQVVLPTGVSTAEFSATVKKTSGNLEYVYTATDSFTGLADGAIRNLSVIVDGDPKDTSDVFTAKANIMSTDGTNIKVRVEVKNLTDITRNFHVRSGTAWHAVDGSLSVGPNGSGYIVMDGCYNGTIVSSGSSGFDVTVSENNGSSQVVSISDAATPGSAGVVVKTATDGGENDRVSAYEYMYAVTIDNTTADAKEAYFNNITITGYKVALVVSDDVVAPIDYRFMVNGYETKTVYVKLIPVVGGDIKNVPSVSWSLSIGGTSVTKTQSAQQVEFTSDSMTASGDEIFNERKGTPAGVWILIAMAILLAIMVCWLASKRGVFSRKN